MIEPERIILKTYRYNLCVLVYHEVIYNWMGLDIKLKSVDEPDLLIGNIIFDDTKTTRAVYNALLGKSSYHQVHPCNFQIRKDDTFDIIKISANDAWNGRYHEALFKRNQLIPLFSYLDMMLSYASFHKKEDTEKNIFLK